MNDRQPPSQEAPPAPEIRRGADFDETTNDRSDPAADRFVVSMLVVIISLFYALAGLGLQEYFSLLAKALNSN